MDELLESHPISGPNGRAAVPPAAEGVGLRIGQRVHAVGNTRRIGTVRYVGAVEGYAGEWVGVDWDDGEGKHDGSLGGIRYFTARGERSGSFVRPKNLSTGISFLEGLHRRYRGNSTKEEEDEMYVFSTSQKHVSIQFVGKNKIQEKLNQFKELLGASVSYLGVSSAETSSEINAIVPNLEELDLTGNLLSRWQDIGTLCEALPSLKILNLTNNLMDCEIPKLPSLVSIRVLVLNNCGITWNQVEKVKESLPSIEELHLMANNLSMIGDIRLSENPIVDPSKGGLPRFVLIARLAKIKMLNGSEVTQRERKESEIRYVRLVMAKMQSDDLEDLRHLHPRFAELKALHGIEYERPSSGIAGPQKMSSGLISVTLKCIGASMGEKQPLTKKLPPTTTVGKLKVLCESFFKLKDIRLRLYIQEEGSPLPLLLEDDMTAIVDLGVGTGTTVLVDEEVSRYPAIGFGYHALDIGFGTPALDRS
ncbi:CAP-Gly domain [Musa troglodytarum]|uniref:CAP-Gly domain n=1 Tax=Musa troglodytarum TaxID=320322 RepID=A0A9E7L3M0_9LILI|nr:CAP-Gly domain [Musa troglodytarum]